MKRLTSTLLGRACRIFLAHAYPDGNLPRKCLPFRAPRPDDDVEPLLCPPLCQPLYDSNGTNELRGYAFRLGSHVFPHVKLQVKWHDGAGTWIFAVDTHDALQLRQDDPDHQRFRDIQAQNRRLKIEVEQAWDTEGLMTFNGLLRQGLDLAPQPS